MRKFLSDKYLNCNLLPFCFRLYPTVSGTGWLERKQPESIRHKLDTKLILSCIVTMDCVFVSVILSGVSKYVF